MGPGAVQVERLANGCSVIVKYLSPRYSSILGTWSPFPRAHFRPEPSPGFLPIAERNAASADASNVKNSFDPGA